MRMNKKGERREKKQKMKKNTPTAAKGKNLRSRESALNCEVELFARCFLLLLLRVRIIIITHTSSHKKRKNAREKQCTHEKEANNLVEKRVRFACRLRNIEA